MSKRTKTRMGHANPTSERNRRKERHSKQEWGVVTLPQAAHQDDRKPRNKKRSAWLARQAASGVDDGTS
jgi:hypothetical protein